MNDLSSLTLRSHLKSRVLMSEISQKSFISDQEIIIIDWSSASDSLFDVTAVSCESFITTTDVEMIRTNVEISIKNKLKQEIQRCEYQYCEKTFVVNDDERSKIVNSNEISYFFFRFQQREWLTNFNLMSLLFSFNWSKTTLILQSFYVSFKSSNQQSNLKMQWSLSRDHDCIIISCCFQSHWMLFDVNLKRIIIRQYDSLVENISNSEMMLIIKEWLIHVMKEWENQNRGFIAVNEVSENFHFFIFSCFSFMITEDLQSSRQQENDSDCEIYMMYNADCLVSNRDTLEKQIDDVRLRYHYLERLVDLERQERSEQQIVNMILSSNKKLRIKKRRVSEDISDDESDQNQEEFKKSRRLNWESSSHLDSQDAWLEKWDHLVTISSKYERSESKHLKRAKELLRMIETVECEKVTTAWDEAITQKQSHIKLETLKIDSTTEIICQLIKRAQIRSFKNKILLCIDKWIFTMKILQDVEIERKRASSEQSTFKIKVDDKEKKALTKAFAKFIREAHSELKESSLAKKRELQYCKYRRWWRDDQIWVYLYNAFDVVILLLISKRQHIKEECAIYNEQ